MNKLLEEIIITIITSFYKALFTSEGRLKVLPTVLPWSLGLDSFLLNPPWGVYSLSNKYALFG